MSCCAWFYVSIMLSLVAILCFFTANSDWWFMYIINIAVITFDVVMIAKDKIQT